MKEKMEYKLENIYSEEELAFLDDAIFDLDNASNRNDGGGVMVKMDSSVTTSDMLYLIFKKRYGYMKNTPLLTKRIIDTISDDVISNSHPMYQLHNGEKMYNWMESLDLTVRRCFRFIGIFNPTEQDIIAVEGDVMLMTDRQMLKSGENTRSHLGKPN